MGFRKRFADDDEDADDGAKRQGAPSIADKAKDRNEVETGAGARGGGPGRTPRQGRKKNGVGNSNSSSNNNSNKGKKAMSSQIRGLERMLRHAHGKLSEAQRAEKTKELNQLRRMVQERERRNHEFKSSRRYHMVRFFERRKIERLLERETDEDKRKQLKSDLYYVKNFPKDRKYVALFPKGGHSAVSSAKVDAIRKQIGAGARAGTREEKVEDNRHRSGGKDDERDGEPNGDSQRKAGIDAKGHSQEDDRGNQEEDKRDDFFL